MSAEVVRRERLRLRCDGSEKCPALFQPKDTLVAALDVAQETIKGTLAAAALITRELRDRAAYYGWRHMPPDTDLCPECGRS